MKLQSRDGASVELSVLRYQFGPSPEPEDWDANWLVVSGTVVTAAGETWTFEDPCLTTWEARALSEWFGRVIRGDLSPTEPGGGESRLFVFTEPNLAFNLAGLSEESLSLQVYLSLECAPPTEETVIFEFFVPIDLSPSELAQARDAWDTQLAAFPVR